MSTATELDAAKHGRMIAEPKEDKALVVIHPQDAESEAHNLPRISLIRDENEAADFALAEMEIAEGLDFLKLLAGDDPALKEADEKDPWRKRDVPKSVLKHRISIDGIGRTDARPPKDVQVGSVGPVMSPEPAKRGFFARHFGK